MIWCCTMSCNFLIFSLCLSGSVLNAIWMPTSRGAPWRMFPHRSGQNLWRGEHPIDWSWMKTTVTGQGFEQRSCCDSADGFDSADEGIGFDRSFEEICGRLQGLVDQTVMRTLKFFSRIRECHLDPFGVDTAKRPGTECMMCMNDGEHFLNLNIEKNIITSSCGEIIHLIEWEAPELFPVFLLHWLCSLVCPEWS